MIILLKLLCKSTLLVYYGKNFVEFYFNCLQFYEFFTHFLFRFLFFIYYIYDLKNLDLN